MKTHLCFAREYHVTRYGHQQTTEQRHGSRNVCYCVKPIQRWGREGFVDKDGIMVAHELSLVHGQAVEYNEEGTYSKADYANCLEHPRPNKGDCM